MTIRVDAATRTFLFADLRGYTEFVERHGDAAAAALIGDYRRLVRGQVARSAGAEIKTEGDSFYLVFPSAGQALDCAVAIARQAEIHNAQVPERPIHVGIGVHAGEPIAHEGQFVGSAVNVAARLAQSAGPGEILVSDVVRGLLRTSGLPPAAERVIRMKGLAAPFRAFAITWAEPAEPSVPAPKAGRIPRLRRIMPAGLRGRATILLGLSALAVVVVVGSMFTTVRPAPAAARLVTVAGLGTAGFSGDGGPATAAQLDRPIGLAFDRAGDLYVADHSPLDVAGRGRGTRIRRIDKAGTIRTVSGDGTVDARDTEFAAAVRLQRETSLAVDGAGTLYLTGSSGIFVGFESSWVAKLSDGTLKIIAGGSGPSGYSGDGGPALSASFGLLRNAGLAVDSLGNVFVADSDSGRIRMVAHDGIITTVAGNGDRGFSGDGGPATAATLFAPVGLAVSPDGSLHIADTNNHRVRKIDHSGNIVTVAGTGAAGYRGDGGPARDAELNLPLGLAFDRTGNLYIADSANNRVRMVDTSGVISTVAGDGSPEQLLLPSTVALDPSGVLYVADTGNHRIRKLVRS